MKEKDTFAIIEILLFSFVILAIGLYPINNLFGMITGVDEFGYICNAKYLLGDNGWKELSGILGYYSYGYSLILMPLILVIKDPTMLFRGIVIVNVCMIEASFLLSVKVVCRRYRNMSKKIIVFVCFIANMYVANFVYSKYIFTEMLIILLFWVLLLILQPLCEKYSGKRMICLAIVSAFLFYVHQRTLAVLCGLIVTLVIITLKKEIPVKGLVFYLLTIMGMILVGNIVKNLIVNNVYVNNDNMGQNDFSGQLSRLKYIFKLDNVVNLILGSFSKFYYFLISTVYVGGMAIVKLGKNCVRTMKNKESVRENYVDIFIIVTFIFSMGIQVYFLMVPNRYDLVIYGRYIEFMYGILIVEGMLSLIVNWENGGRYLLFSFIISVVGGCSAIRLFEKYDLQLSVSYLAPAVFVFFDGKYQLKEGVYISLMIAAALGSLLGISYKTCIKSGNRKVVLVGIILLCFWGKSYCLLSNAILSDQELLKNEYLCFAEYMSDSSNEIGVLYEADMGLNRVQQLQYLCPQKVFHFVKIDNIEMYKNYLILAARSSTFANELRNEGRTIIYQNYRYNLWGNQPKELTEWGVEW